MDVGDRYKKMRRMKMRNEEGGERGGSSGSGRRYALLDSVEGVRGVIGIALGHLNAHIRIDAPILHLGERREGKRKREDKMRQEGKRNGRGGEA